MYHFTTFHKNDMFTLHTKCLKKNGRKKHFVDGIVRCQSQLIYSPPTIFDSTI